MSFDVGYISIPLSKYIKAIRATVYRLNLSVCSPEATIHTHNSDNTYLCVSVRLRMAMGIPTMCYQKSYCMELNIGRSPVCVDH